MPHRIVERITKEEVNQLPLIRFEGQIHLIRSDREVPAAIEQIAPAEILGFDTETRPVFRPGQKSGGPALLQLATLDEVWLFQLRKIKHLEPLFAILANPTILKTGVAPHDDIKGLRSLSDFEPANFTDISKIASGLGIITTGLRNLTAMFLGGRLSKRAQVSNWAVENLSTAQKVYAATDAWISLRLHLELTEVVANIKSDPPSTRPDENTPAELPPTEDAPETIETETKA